MNDSGVQRLHRHDVPYREVRTVRTVRSGVCLVRMLCTYRYVSSVYVLLLAALCMHRAHHRAQHRAQHGAQQENQIERERERERDRETERQRDREGQRGTETERQRQRGSAEYKN